MYQSFKMLRFSNHFRSGMLGSHSVTVDIKKKKVKANHVYREVAAICSPSFLYLGNLIDRPFNHQNNQLLFGAVDVCLSSHTTSPFFYTFPFPSSYFVCFMIRSMLVICFCFFSFRKLSHCSLDYILCFRIRKDRLTNILFHMQKTLAISVMGF